MFYYLGLDGEIPDDDDDGGTDDEDDDNEHAGDADENETD